MTSIKVEDVGQICERSPFVAYLGFQIAHFEEGKVILELPIDNKLMNLKKTVHGGVYATMLDNILGTTIRSIVNCPVTTINLNIHYIDSISEGKMIATAKLLKQGYKTLIGEGEITDGNGKLLAKGIGTFKIRRK